MVLTSMFDNTVIAAVNNEHTSHTYIYICVYSYFIDAMHIYICELNAVPPSSFRVVAYDLFVKHSL